jgi:hypothetical protein
LRWLRAGGRSAEPDPGGLAPVRIITDVLELTGFIAPTGQRVTDMLLRGQDLAFLPSGAAPEPRNWVSVAPTDVLVVIPPPLPGRSSVAPEQQLARVVIQVGAYRVEGTIHLQPGESVGPRLSARQPFFPVTSATLHRPDLAPEAVEVAITNVARANRFDLAG